MLAAVDGKRDTGDGRRMREIEDGLRNVFGAGSALERKALCLGGELHLSLAWTRERRARRHRIDSNFRRERLRQCRGCGKERALAQSVGKKPRVWLEHTLIENIDNRSVEPRRGLPDEGLRQEKRRLQIDGDCPLETRMRHCFDIVGFEFAGVVDQEREWPER